MPIRVRSRPQFQEVARELSPVPVRYDTELPEIFQDDDFRLVIKKISLYITDVVELPSTFEQLRTTAAGNSLRALVDHLSHTCSNPAIVNALLALKWHYATDSDENKGLNEARANACEIVAWRFLTRLSEREAVDYCLYEIPDFRTAGNSSEREAGSEESGERSPLLSRVLPGNDQNVPQAVPVGSSSRRSQLLSSLSRLTNNSSAEGEEAETSPTEAFKSLNALEIAAIADAKRFLSQHVVQKIITGIWNGDIVFWDALSVNAKKSPRFYNPHTADPFSRLRVPKYLKWWEILFFAGFLCLYYSVLVTREESRITGTEVALFLWIAAFCYGELSEWIDAGSVFYATDIWNLFDMVMILIGLIFAVLRIIGILRHDTYINDLAFDVLSLEALFMIPRICSILSLSPYWGTLIPCLKEMGKDFLRFMVIVVIVYGGFLTTFSLIGRHVFDLGRMAGILTKIFFGSSYVGFEIMDQIDPIFGPPLMIIFITLTSILLTGSLTGILSNSFSRVTTHAREEYLYVYSVYVLEASTSNRLTHFYPPFNLVAFVIFRPWRLIFAAKGERFRAGRILLLKLTHVPIVGAIQLYELLSRRHKVAVERDEFAGFKGPKESKARSRRSAGPPQARSSSAQQRAPERRTASLHPDNAARRGPSAGSGVEDDIEAPSALEAQMEDMNKKMDELKALVMALQENRPVAGVSASEGISSAA